MALTGDFNSKDTQLVMMQPKTRLKNPNSVRLSEFDSPRLIFSKQEELLQFVSMAKRIADMVANKKLPETAPHFSCALSSLRTLKDFPVTPDCLKSSEVMNCVECLTKHPAVKIRTEASIMIESWKRKLPSLKPCTTAKVEELAYTLRNKQDQGSTSSCNLREKIRGGLLEALSKVADEASAEVTRGCDPVEIAGAVELSMYKKMGQSSGSNMAKYRSILFNLKDPKNPELRRRVLLGEIRPDELVEMKAEEMGSSKRKRENEEIRLKALFGPVQKRRT